MCMPLSNSNQRVIVEKIMDEHGSVVLLTDRLTASHIASSAEWIENETTRLTRKRPTLSQDYTAKQGGSLLYQRLLPSGSSKFKDLSIILWLLDPSYIDLPYSFLFHIFQLPRRKRLHPQCSKGWAKRSRLDALEKKCALPMNRTRSPPGKPVSDGQEIADLKLRRVALPASELACFSWRTKSHTQILEFHYL